MHIIESYEIQEVPGIKCNMQILVEISASVKPQKNDPQHLCKHRKVSSFNRGKQEKSKNFKMNIEVTNRQRWKRGQKKLRKKRWKEKFDFRNGPFKISER